jgi:hypothetical protein
MRSALDAALSTVRDARRSNDPSRMRAALEKVEQSLGGMQQHMSMCTGMMDKMSQMMGGRRGMGPRGGQPDATPAPQP